MLIINADDWGRSKAATDSAAACFAKGRITSATAMVFMADSERGAQVANDLKIDVGLHLNLSEPFTGPSVPADLKEAHNAVCRFLTASKYALLVYNPVLRRQFARVVSVQIEEFGRLMGRTPSHLDGHQHLHLCSNVLLDRLLPAGMKVRRSFSFVAGEKNVVNRAYRSVVDRALTRRQRLTDYFFALSQSMQPERLGGVLTLARENSVELMTHPEKRPEFEFLIAGEFGGVLTDVRLASYASL